VIDWEPVLRLPLMYHLVQHRVLYLCPGVPVKMSPAQRDLDRVTVGRVHRKLPQTALHATGYSYGDLAQRPSEVREIQLAVQRLEPVK
jgi:hypothetical protein